MRNEKLIGLRQAAGLTQAQVAARAQIDIRTYRRYELGEIALGDVAGRRLLQMAELFGVTVDYLLNGAEIKEREIQKGTEE